VCRVVPEPRQEWQMPWAFDGGYGALIAQQRRVYWSLFGQLWLSICFA
jgi:hypothetical protein